MACFYLGAEPPAKTPYFTNARLDTLISAGRQYKEAEQKLKELRRKKDPVTQATTQSGFQFDIKKHWPYVAGAGVGLTVLIFTLSKRKAQS